MDVPEIGEQNSPSFTTEEVSTISSKAGGYLRTLYILLAVTGLRIEEAVALQAEDLRGAVLHDGHSRWNGKLYTPKTDAGIREVDIHPSLASILREHIGKRTTGFVFQSSRGTPLARSNVLRRSLHKILQEMGRRKSGFHGFRRYRINPLRNERETEVPLRIWVGHATHGITDRYTMDALKRDVKLRRETAEQVGLGFHMRDVETKLPVAPSAR